MNNDFDDIVTNPRGKEGDQKSFSDLCEVRYKRRDFLRSGAVLGMGLSVLGLSACGDSDQEKDEKKDQAKIDAKPTGERFDFSEISHGEDGTHHVAADHEAKVLIRWGDALFADSPEFDPNAQTVESQLKQFGYNNDYIGYLELEPKQGEQARALLCVNHEYPIAGLMFPNFPEDGYANITEEQAQITQACVGNSIVEIVQNNGEWSVDVNSQYNRRISAYDTEIELSGPAAGHARLKTNADASGKQVIGTVNNCAGGMTPWGTYLSCEENFNGHFGGQLDANHPETENHQRFNVPRDYTGWYKYDTRFDVGVEPNEPNRFGWVVEIDPLKPNAKPVKRTALGRFKHEGAETIVAKSGQLVIYMGDDQRFEYLYKFVSKDKVDLDNKSNNKNLLDEGTLYVAKFEADGNLQWLPLSMENKLLTDEFESQADILIDTRKAADLLGATPLDRPEDVEPNPINGKVYVMLTNNHKREEIDHGSPRTQNYFGHIIELSELDDDHSAEQAKWDVLVQCGNPDDPEHKADWNESTSKDGWFASPDNAAVDSSGRLWISTDQGSKTAMSGTADGLWALETEGEQRGTGKMFFRVPVGAEMCGPVFSDNGESLFLAVQHPGDVGDRGQVRVETAGTLWPDFKQGMPPKPSIVVVTKKGGGRIG
jgi:secreted PhoX family phosphatase